MNWKQERIQGNVVAFPGETVDHENAGEFESRLLPMVDQAATTSGALIIDFRDVDYMTSVGLRVLMIAAKTAGPVSVNILVTGMNETMREIFKISGFEKLFAIYESLESALAATSAT
jgi:anti-anti-sigma factor